MPKSQLKVTNVTGTSTEAAWSQTYHAGGVTAVVTVRKKAKTDDSSLSIVGKDLLNTFESEYFTLETKNLASIKSAVDLTYQKSKDTHDISLIVSAVIQNAVYVVLAGKGKILLVRHNTLATLLEQNEGDEVISASGFLEPEDIMILETPEFAEKVPTSTLLETFSDNSLEDASEIISPALHKEKNGAAAAVFFMYQEEAPIASVMQPVKEPEMPLPQTEEVQEPESEPVLNEEIKPDELKPVQEKKKKLLSHRQKIFLTIAVVLAVVFVSAIYFSLQKKQTNQNSALFSTLYSPAEKKYEEGLGLKDLNASLAQSDFLSAQKMLTDAKSKFSANSKEEQQIDSLLSKVNKEITPEDTTATTNATKVASGTDDFMDFISSHTSEKYFAEDTTNYYFADATGITKVTKSTKKSSQVIKNDSDWKMLAGFATYLGNMYVLDSADGVDKYAVTASGFGNKTAYFSGTAPDLSKAVSMAIDGSIWILTSDGKVSQYTKGKPVSFSITGLSTPLSSPSQITTTSDDDNLYILDNGNSRIVVIKKDTGAFVAEYKNNLLKSATQIDVSEKDKKAYILSGSDIYEMDLK